MHHRLLDDDGSSRSGRIVRNLSRHRTIPRHRTIRTIAVIGLTVLLLSCAHRDEARAEEAIPSPPREFRAAWVATVANIDWPSAPGLPAEQQKEEALAILDRLVALNMNAVVLQVRPQADALYDSKLEPWSFYLTGQQGRPPEPWYDPLAFWVEEAHARGLQLHAWCNPYRANHPGHRGELSEDSIVRARPELVVTLGNRGYSWMDPARKEVQQHSMAVVLDIVRRYDVDGVHFDDYFYPYRDYNDGQDFPDEASWSAYRNAGGRLSRDDWRRQAVNTFIQRIYREIKAIKPQVEFGISPFGIWRPGHPRGISGFDQYGGLYADAKLWLNQGWVDYYMPQLYWRIAQIPQSFPVLLGWWSRENHQERHLWPGLSITHAREDPGATEIVNQIMITRGMTPSSPGTCFFSMRSLQRGDRPLAEKLLQGPYATPALIPPSPWLDDEPPAAPVVSLTQANGGVVASWTPGGAEPPFLWVVYTRRGGSWSYSILPAGTRSLSLPLTDPDFEKIAVSAVDRTRNESPPTILEYGAR